MSHTGPTGPTASLPDRRSLGQMIAERLRTGIADYRRAWDASGPVTHCVIDDLLPEPLARQIFAAFPSDEVLMQRASIRERKRVGVEIGTYAPLIGEVLFAFQEPEVVAATAELTGLAGTQPDPTLYASGVSVMGEGDFLNPHLDNSHDGDQRLYRTLNLLYYISADWNEEFGGNLELWDEAVANRVTVPARFNRLVLMLTDRTSWHSVSRVAVARRRMCVSNYYFSAVPPTGADYRHVTTFAGRPEERGKRVLLWADGMCRNVLGRLFPSLLKKTKHRLAAPPEIPPAPDRASAPRPADPDVSAPNRDTVS